MNAVINVDRSSNLCHFPSLLRFVVELMGSKRVSFSLAVTPLATLPNFLFTHGRREAGTKSSQSKALNSIALFSFWGINVVHD